MVALGDSYSTAQGVGVHDSSRSRSRHDRRLAGGGREGPAREPRGHAITKNQVAKLIAAAKDHSDTSEAIVRLLVTNGLRVSEVSRCSSSCSSANRTAGSACRCMAYAEFGIGRARTAGNAGRWTGVGADRGHGGRAAQRSAVRSRRAPAAARSRACPPARGGRGRAAGSRSRYQSASRAGPAHAAGRARPARGPRGRDHGRALGSSTDIHARWPAPRTPPAAAGHGQMTAVGGDHVCVEIADHGRVAELQRQSPNARKMVVYCRRVLADAARAAIRSASPNRFRCSNPDIAGAAITTASASSSAIVPWTSSTVGSAGARKSCCSLTDPACSRNLASRVAFNRASDVSAAASRDTRLAAERHGFSPLPLGFSATLPARNPAKYHQKSLLRGRYLGFAKRSFQTQGQGVARLQRPARWPG
jgi:hypothetical protein